jgi:hypothetical protein
MRSYRVHACATEAGGKIPYLTLSLVGAHRVSMDLGPMQVGPGPSLTLALTMDALYELLQGKSIKADRTGGAVRLSPDGDQLIIEQDGHLSQRRVWMTELALAWNMLSGFGRAEIVKAGRPL